MKQSLSIFHKLWQRLPAESRRRFFAWATALAVPPVRPVKPVSAHGIIVAGEFSRSSGLGEGARLMARALRDMNIPCATWDIDRQVLEGDVTGPGAPLVMHVNAPMLPYAQLFMPRTLHTRRRIIGYWAWELPVVPETWRHARRHVHEIWAPSRFTGMPCARWDDRSGLSSIRLDWRSRNRQTATVPRSGCRKTASLFLFRSALPPAWSAKARLKPFAPSGRLLATGRTGFWL